MMEQALAEFLPAFGDVTLPPDKKPLDLQRIASSRPGQPVHVNVCHGLAFLALPLALGFGLFSPNIDAMLIPTFRRAEPKGIILGFWNELTMALLAFAGLSTAGIAKLHVSKSGELGFAHGAFLIHIPEGYDFR